MSLESLLSLIETVLLYPLFTINQTTVTLSSIIMLVLIMLAFVVSSRVLIKRLLMTVLMRTRLDKGLQYTFTRITHYLIMVIGGVIAFQIIGIDLSGLMVIFGFLSVGIGFGLQNVTANFISGLILLFERPIMVGDRVSIGGTEGDVEEINIRSTTVRSLNNVSIIVPNSEFISSNVVNWSHEDTRLLMDIKVGVAYDSDLDLVLRSLQDVAAENTDVLAKPAPQVYFEAFGDSAWNMNLRVWIADAKQHRRVRSDLNCAIVRKFRQAKIEIPFPQRDVHFRAQAPPAVSAEAARDVL